MDAQEPVSDDEFESFGAMDVRTVKRLPASRCEPDHSETNMSSIWFLSIRQHEDSLHSESDMWKYEEFLAAVASLF